ncbi:MAG: GNAT family N-acetyltransferase [Alphaproteobacteria bacterium]|nr:GNAT family N-acetyltransferase [Alphaproteobacteria bacterium]
MLDASKMPELIEDDIIELHARINHKFDAELWAEIDKNRHFLRQYLLWVDKTNSIDDCTSATDMFTNLWQNNENYAYSIVLKATGKAIGSIDIHNIDCKNNSADIGYWLAEEYNGQGLVSRAVKLIEKEAFSRGIHRLVIAVQEGNTPSSRVAERNNYIYEGLLKDALYKYGTYYNEKIFAKINKE